MSPPNRQQRRATTKSLPPNAPSSIPITDPEERKALSEANQRVIELRRDLGRQQRQLCAHTLQRDRTALVGSEEELAGVQIQLMVAEQKRNEAAQALIDSNNKLKEVADIIATAYGIKVNDPEAGKFNLNLETMIITRIDSPRSS